MEIVQYFLKINKYLFISILQTIIRLIQQAIQRIKRMESLIKLSAPYLYFPKDTSEISITITNTSEDKLSYFKTKTTRLNFYEVKPARGMLQPGEEKQINFKMLKQLKTPEQIINAENKEKIMFEFFNVEKDDLPKNKEELSEIWAKNKNANDKNIQSVTLSLKVQNDTILKSSQSQTRKTFKAFAASEIKDESYETNLPKNYQNLKEEEEKLLKQREKIFKSQQSPKGITKSKSSLSSILSLIIIFFVGFVLGNFLKMRIL